MARRLWRYPSMMSTAQPMCVVQNFCDNRFTIILNILILFIVSAVVALLVCYNGIKNINSKTRIDLNAARRAVSKVEFPKILYDYEFNSDSTGIFDDWDKSDVSLGDMCNSIAQGLKYSHHAQRNSPDAVLAVTVAENFMIRYKLKLDQSDLFGIPWGNNWYEFSVSSTIMAAYYLLLPNVKLTELASDLILKLLTSPRKSLGYERDGANTVYMAGPYLLAKYFKGQVDEVWDMKEYKYVLNYLKFNITHQQGVDGFHMDKTYVFHSGLVTYAYLKTLADDLTIYFYKLDSFITDSPECIWYSVRNLLCHPTIGVSAMGVLGRNEDLALETNKSSPFGIKVIPFARYIRYFTDKHQFSMRLMVPWYGFFEADRKNYTQSQYWTQYRTVHTANSSKSIKFPDAGFICTEDVTELIPIPSTSITTTVFKPKLADSFVLVYDRYGIAWQTYIIDQFGLQTVTELVIIDSKVNTITIKLTINNDNSKPVIYYSVDEPCSIDIYRSKLKPLIVDVKTIARYTTYFDLNANTVMTKRTCDENLLPLNLENGIRVEVLRDPETAVLRKNGTAFVICPKNQVFESPTIVLTGEGSFKFDDRVNQYIRTEYSRI